MKVIGITSGIGSLQFGFKQAGWDVEHSHEWRKYYNTGTFEFNFGKQYTESYDVDRRFTGVDAIVSHPECGNYSNLYCGKNRLTREQDPGDIYKFIELAKLYKPKFFLVDNLPKSINAVSQAEWKKQFKNYNIQMEMVSNFGYGNTQRFRNRLFIIGSHKDLKYSFVPGERKHDDRLADAIDGIRDDVPNHKKMQLDNLTQWSSYQIGGENGSKRLKLKEIQQWFSKAKIRANLPYYNLNGELKFKPGYSILDREHFSPVLSGGGGLYDNHWIFDEYYRPLTMRERLRIQGFTDDFVIKPLDFEFGSRDHQGLIKQTGKCMPVQFPEYFARQVKEFLNNGTLPDKGTRLVKGLNQITIKI